MTYGYRSSDIGRRSADDSEMWSAVETLGLPVRLLTVLKDVKYACLEVIISPTPEAAKRQMRKDNNQKGNVEVDNGYIGSVHNPLSFVTCLKPGIFN